MRFAQSQQPANDDSYSYMLYYDNKKHKNRELQLRHPRRGYSSLRIKENIINDQVWPLA